LVRTSDSDKLGFIGGFRDGKAAGTFWLKMIGGGFMHGKVPMILRSIYTRGTR
jgi:hypothetical protein